MPFLSGDSEVLNSYFKEAPLAKKKSRNWVNSHSLKLILRINQVKIIQGIQ